MLASVSESLGADKNNRANSMISVDNGVIDDDDDDDDNNNNNNNNDNKNNNNDEYRNSSR